MLQNGTWRHLRIATSFGVLTRLLPPLCACSALAGMEDLDCVLSLGSPLRPPPRGIPGVFDQTRGILTYVDDKCPGPAELQAAVRTQHAAMPRHALRATWG
jgi:hypothetical protein